MVTLDKFAKITEERLKGFNKSQVSRHLELDYKTVDKYWGMTNEEYIKLSHWELKVEIRRLINIKI